MGLKALVSDETGEAERRQKANIISVLNLPFSLVIIMITNQIKKKEKIENKRRKLDLSFSPVNPDAIKKDSAS